MDEHHISLVMTNAIYFSGLDKNEIDFSTYMVGLYPYADGERYINPRTVYVDGEQCASVRLSLNATEEQEQKNSIYPNEMQQEYLRHLLKRGLLLDVLVDDVSIKKLLFSEVSIR